MTDTEIPSEFALKDPKLMRTWGELNALWDDIEYLLYRAFDSMLLDERPQATRAIFFSQKSHAARRSMVEELAKEFLRWPRDPKPLKNAMKRVKARSDTRNALAHGLWGWLGEGEKRQVARFPIKPNWEEEIDTKAYSQEELERACVEMRETREALWKAVKPIEQEKSEKFHKELVSRIRSSGADV